jgi:hypothetical protein
MVNTKLIVQFGSDFAQKRVKLRAARLSLECV